MLARLNRDALWGLVLLLLAAWAGWMISNQSAGHALRGAPGATFFPGILAGALAVLAVILLIQGLVSQQPRVLQDVNWRSIARVVAVMALTIAYVQAMDRLPGLLRALGGFPVRGTAFSLTTPPFLAGLLVLLGERRWWLVGLLALVTTGALYVAFVELLNVRFP